MSITRSSCRKEYESWRHLQQVTYYQIARTTITIIVTRYELSELDYTNDTCDKHNNLEVMIRNDKESKQRK